MNTSSTNIGDYFSVFKYSTCVKECPSGNPNTTVKCLQPKKFDDDAPGKFENCVYYPMGANRKDVYIRYGTESCKLHFLFINASFIIVLNKYCIPNSEALRDQVIKQFKENFFSKFDVDKYTAYIADLFKAWYV